MAIPDAILEKAGDTARTATQNGASLSADPNAHWYDVMTNTGAGLVDHVAGADAQYIATHAVPAAAMVDSSKRIAEAMGRDWESSDCDGIKDGMSQQASAIADQAASIWDGKSPDGKDLTTFQRVGTAFGMLTSVEQLVSMPLSMIPFPALPALRILDTDIGLPHAHMHPPNLTPPNPVPVPLPSTGPVIPIPILSGASKVLINNMPAARCGDMGLGVFCGGYFPMYEVFLGSSNVWIEGSRAGRVGVDITKHCIFSAPKPSDPPVGPMFGTTINCSPNVVIGGVPMPSLTSMAMGKMFKALFKGIGKAIGALRRGASKGAGKGAARAANEAFEQAAKKPGKIRALIDKFRKKPPVRPAVNTLPPAPHLMVNDLIAQGKIIINDGGDAAFRKAVKDDLVRIANNKVGKNTLKELANGPHPVTIEKYDKTVSYGGRPPGTVGAHAQTGAGRNVPGTGSPTTVRYDPTDPDYLKRANSPSDATLHHELAHARNAALGESMSDVKRPPGMDPIRGSMWENKWSNIEEHDVITNYDNPYRELEGLPTRTGHDHIPR